MHKSWVAAVLLAAGILPASATTLTGILMADDAYFAYLSTDDAVRGTLLRQGELRLPLDSLPTTTLTSGTTYYLHIIVENAGGDGRFTGEFALSGGGFTFANGGSTLVTSGAAGLWRGVFIASFAYFGPVEQPWVQPTAGVTEAPASLGTSPSIWPSDAQSDPAGPCQSCAVAFSTTITPSAVQEPLSAALLGAGLLGLGLVRRRA